MDRAIAMTGASAMLPPRIRPGQLIGVCAPAGPIRADRLRAGLARLGDTFAVRVAEGVTAPRAASTPSYLAAPDDIRAAELNAMLADPDVRAIILARGGYGLMRILPALDPALLRRDPKPIVAFSDGTALLSWAHHAGVRGIHGPMIGQLADLPAADVAHLIAMLTDPTPAGARPWPLQISTTRVAPAAASTGTEHTTGVRAGRLVPANLTLASLLVGTPWALPLHDAVLLVEEVGERPYELDRYLTQLLLTGALTGLSAVVLGDLTRCHDASPPSGVPDPDDAALAVFRERLAALPLAIGAPIGHGTRNEAVPFGARVELDLARGVLSILDAAVE